MYSYCPVSLLNDSKTMNVKSVNKDRSSIIKNFKRNKKSYVQIYGGVSFCASVKDDVIPGKSKIVYIAI